MNQTETLNDSGLTPSKNDSILSGMTIVTSLCHCVLGSIGIPLNGFIAYAIVSIDELRTQTRYVLFLGMLVGNILSFFNLFTEVAYYLSVFDHNCQVLRVLLGVPYVVFFANYLLVLVDNYFAISHRLSPDQIHHRQRHSLPNRFHNFCLRHCQVSLPCRRRSTRL